MKTPNYDNYKEKLDRDNRDRVLKIAKELEDKVPITKGCKSDQCFCTGKCQEIIGWRDKTPEEKRGGQWTNQN